MDLWIRSQDKSVLEKIEGLRVDGFRGEYYIATYTHSLGEYKTKERALEVLDEIDECMSNAVNNGLNVAHYIMPEE